MDLEVMVMKGYSKFPKYPGMEHHPQMQFNVMPRTLNAFKYFYLTLIIQCHLFVCTQLTGFKYNRWFDSSIWPTGGTLTAAAIPGESWPGSNRNEEVLEIFQKFRDCSLTIRCSLVLYPGQSVGREGLFLISGLVGVCSCAYGQIRNSMF